MGCPFHGYVDAAIGLADRAAAGGDDDGRLVFGDGGRALQGGTCVQCFAVIFGRFHLCAQSGVKELPVAVTCRRVFTTVLRQNVSSEPCRQIPP